MEGEDPHSVPSVGGRAAAMSLDLGDFSQVETDRSARSEFETRVHEAGSNSAVSSSESLHRSKLPPAAPTPSDHSTQRPVVLARNSNLTPDRITAGMRRVDGRPPPETANPPHPVSDTDSVDSTERMTVAEARSTALDSSAQYLSAHFPQLARALRQRATAAQRSGMDTEALMQALNSAAESDQGADRALSRVPPTGYVYDERCVRHRHPTQDHPECPERVMSIVQALRLCGLESQLATVAAREATAAEIAAVHSQQHVERVFSMRDAQVREQMQEELAHNSAFANEHTVEAALVSAGGTLALTEAVCGGRVRNGLAVLRPPGHHAECSTVMGFCVFNNVAMAAAWAVKEAPRFEADRPNRVLVIDWDVHHGNGTQHMFESDPNVMYISIHRWDYGHFFPPGPDGGPDCVGVGAGTGKNINIAWNGPGPFGDAEYLAAFAHVVMPAGRAFAPDLVLVSAGFDAAAGDPLGGCFVSPAGYAHMLHQLSALAAGRLVVSLEGGYNLRALAESAVACTAVLLGAPPPPLGQLAGPCAAAVQSLTKTVHAHARVFAAGRVPGDRFPDWTAFSGLAPDHQSAPDTVHHTRHQNYVPNHMHPAFRPTPAEPPPLLRGDSFSQQAALRSMSAPVPLNQLAPPGANPFVFPASPGLLFPSRSTTPTLDQPPLLPALGTRPPGAQPARQTAIEEYMQLLSSAGGHSPGAGPHPRAPHEPREESMDVQHDAGAGQEGAGKATSADQREFAEVRQEDEEMRFHGGQGAAEGFQIHPLQASPNVAQHVSALEFREDSINVRDSCVACGTRTECWACLKCFRVYCGRHVNQHMLAHSKESGHLIAVSFADLSVWDYGLERYLDGLVIPELKPITNALHRQKFHKDASFPVLGQGAKPILEMEAGVAKSTDSSHVHLPKPAIPPKQQVDSFTNNTAS